MPKHRPFRRLKSLMELGAPRARGLPQAELAENSGEEAVRRVELLRLRFQEGLPIREIAKQWNVDAATLHREQTKARREFQAALLDVLAFHHTGSDTEIRREAEAVLSMLG